MATKMTKYYIIIPLGIGLFLLLFLTLGPAIMVNEFLSSTFMQWWLISALVILPMAYLGVYLDRKVFKLTGTLAKSKKKSIADKKPDEFMKCPHCGQSIKIGSEFCSYCSEKIT